MSESGFYAWRTRPPSERAIRHAWLTDLIRQIHADFRGVYGYRRVHAELTLGHGLAVGEEAVWLLMREAGLQGLTGRPAYRRIPHAADRRRSGRSQLRPQRPGPSVGHRHHRAPHPGGQGLLRGRARRVLPPGRRLVDRRRARPQRWSPTRWAWPSASRNPTRQDRDPLRPAARRADSTGRRNTSSMEVLMGDDEGAAAGGPVVSGADPVAGSADGGVARGSGPVLGGDRSRREDRGRGGGERACHPRSGSGGSVTLAA